MKNARITLYQVGMNGSSKIEIWLDQTRLKSAAEIIFRLRRWKIFWSTRKFFRFAWVSCPLAIFQHRTTVVWLSLVQADGQWGPCHVWRWERRRFFRRSRKKRGDFWEENRCNNNYRTFFDAFIQRAGHRWFWSFSDCNWLMVSTCFTAQIFFEVI